MTPQPPRDARDLDLDLARRFLTTHPPRGTLILCAVTGSHIYGFPSADSDIDLKGIHLAPAADVLGLDEPQATHDLTETLDGTECDLTTHEAKVALNLLLRGNGNILERILSPIQLVEPTDELQDLARGAIAKAFSRHYRGFFRGCQREHDRRPTAKSLLYTLRVALTGIHLLRTGTLETNLTNLPPLLDLPLDELLAHKREGPEKHPLPRDLDALGRARWPSLEAALDDAERDSHLPDEPTNRDAIQAWLVRQRLQSLR